MQYLLDKLGIETEITGQLRELRSAAVSPLDTEVPNLCQSVAGGFGS